MALNTQSIHIDCMQYLCYKKKCAAREIKQRILYINMVMFFFKTAF